LKRLLISLGLLLLVGIAALLFQAMEPSMEKLVNLSVY
jgi:hypothetical protein